MLLYFPLAPIWNSPTWQFPWVNTIWVNRQRALSSLDEYSIALQDVHNRV